MDFAIIRFTDEEDAPGIVSTKWIDTRNNTCWYPNVRTEEKKNKLLVSHASPKKEWLNCPMRILKTFSSYQSARRHLREAEDTSNLETDSECIRPRKRKKKSFHFPGSSSEDESPSLLASRQQNEAYPPPPLSSSLTFSPPPATSSLISTPAVASLPSSNNEVLNNKMEKILNNQQNLWQLMEELLESNRRIEHKLDTFITHQRVQPISQEDEEMSFISLLPLGFEDFVKFDKKIAENSGLKKRLVFKFIHDYRSKGCKDTCVQHYEKINDGCGRGKIFPYGEVNGSNETAI
ncbi:hypothetical protein AVEN_103342-1 [Araneus ventricosus]|uniref:Uncharacterized protein n=1 Tax=Araneus ventricosus TaxID=182803 RepID=A0A4Y2HA56_ARAVE|nr:hypothetical protein AVEN_103342-1 [Araneus ventricosus]